MKRQLGYGGFPSVFLTFSLLLLVLALGFVAGRLVVARLYLSQAPHFPKREVSEVEAATVGYDASRRRPGRVFVPPPAPPDEPPEDTVGLAEPTDAGAVGLGPEDAGAVGVGPEREDSPARRVPDQPRPREDRQPVDAAPAADTPKTEATPAAPKEQPERAETASARYSVQVGLFSSVQGARKLEAELMEGGYSTRIEVEAREGRTLYRVLTGSYRTEYAARKAVESLRRQGFQAFLVQR